MTQVLVIESSANLASSVSRDLTKAFLAGYTAAHADTTVVTHDLVTDTVPHLGVDLIGGFFGKPEALTEAQAAAIALSDKLIGQVEAADVVAIGAAMYNFSIPSTLKAWIDHILRAGRTFKYTENGPQGLLTGKKVFLFLASGGIYSDGPYKPYDFQETYLRAALGFIGLTDVTVVRAEGLALGPDAAAKAVADAKAAVAALSL
ncbi:FMN-dependent NADH-azoreductase [Acidisoma cellulosilytica]|uniref:FMN dependent NADH:quinone oxidoreductase n=1 Tax=Acidisoma cellulosilyticum TaxID=2802395 RepID=A0A963Z4I0_9PROT|nr:FMN-dependent NADH-azoreductase [Acidisoma cellulosilyticum]MCB8882381.1 FMN-dependent NADH-azoreductase [Acidisoma cellulosilyticum]